MKFEAFGGINKKEINNKKGNLGGFNKLKTLGMSVLLLLGAKEGFSQTELQTLSKYAEKVEEKNKINIDNMSPIEIYKNFSLEEGLKDMDVEDVDKLRESNIAPLSFFIEKQNKIAEDAGFEESPEFMDIRDGESAEDYKKRYIVNKLKFQEKVGDKLEDFCNKYLKGKRKYYKEQLRDLNNFKGGYLFGSDISLSKGILFNHFYSKEEKDNYKENLKAYLNKEFGHSSNMKYDFHKSQEEIEEMAEDVWDWNKIDFNRKKEINPNDRT